MSALLMVNGFKGRTLLPYIKNQRPLFASSQMGYGSRALTLLQMYYEGKFPCLEEETVQKPKEITTVNSEVWFCFFFFFIFCHGKLHNFPCKSPLCSEEILSFDFHREVEL